MPFSGFSDDQIQIAERSEMGALLIRIEGLHHPGKGSGDYRAFCCTEHRLLRRKACLQHKFIRIRSGKCRPAVTPGLLLIRDVADELTRMDQEAVSRAQRIFAVLGGEEAVAGFDEMEQIIVIDLRAGLMHRQGLAFTGKQHMQILLIIINGV
ncbi:hypothetical protein D3C75_820520 [compost metagenome]